MREDPSVVVMMLFGWEAREYEMKLSIGRGAEEGRKDGKK